MPGGHTRASSTTPNGRELDSRGSAGILKIVLNMGLGDPLQKHEYNVSAYSRDQNRISMKTDGNQVALIWVEDDDI